MVYLMIGIMVKKAKSYLLDKSLADNVSFLILGAGDVEDFARALVAKC